MSYQKTSELELQGFARRLNETCDDMGLAPKFTGRQVELAKIMSDLTGESITPKAVRKWLEGEGFPSTDKIFLLARWAEKNAEWLSTGRGEKSYIGGAAYNNIHISTVLEIMEAMPEEMQIQLEKVAIAFASPTTWPTQNSPALNEVIDNQTSQATKQVASPASADQQKATKI